MDLQKIFTSDVQLREILTILASLGLKDCWLAAGTLRNFIWNTLSNRDGFDHQSDVDVVFFDPSVSEEEATVIQNKLNKTYPQYDWEVKNQAYMHQHSPGTAPYQSARDAVSKYPETCTANAARLLEDSTIEFFCLMEKRI